MKVLMLTQVLPYPPDSGPKVKAWHTLKYLSQRHEVTLVSFVRGDRSADVAYLRQHCHAVHTVPMERGKMRDGRALVRSLLTGQPWLMVRDDRRAMRAMVDRLAGEEAFDVVHADQLNMAQYALRVPGAFKVLDTHNALWLLYRRMAKVLPIGPQRLLLERDWRLLRWYEGEMVRRFDGVIAVSEEDRAALLEAAGVDREVVVIPISVDTEAIQPVKRDPGASRVLYVGTMYWPPNVDGVLWFARHVWPLVRRERPNAGWDIVGARPPATVRALDGDGTGVRVAGYVPDLAPYLRRAALLVVPLRVGSGMRVKILDAWARGLPVVSTHLGCEGIDATSGRDVLVEDTPVGFAAAVLRVLNEPALARRLAEEGRRTVVERYDYRVAYRPLDGIYEEAKAR